MTTPGPKLLAAEILAAFLYFGLAILGSGGFAAFFSHPPLTAVTITGFALLGAAFFTAGNVSPGEREDRSNRWVLPAFGVLGLLSAFVPAHTDRIGFWTLDGEAVRWLGAALFAAGGALRIWPVFVLGRRFSGLVAIHRSIGSSPAASMASSATRAMRGFSSTPPAGRSPSAPALGLC